MRTNHLTDADCRRDLEGLYNGDAVVVPTSIEHAEYMIRVASFYINQQHEQTMRVLKGEHS